MRPPLSVRVVLVLVVVAVVAACRSGGLRPPSAEEIVQGFTDSTFTVDTISDGSTVGISQAHWVARRRSLDTQEFWTDISVLDVPGAERNAKSMDQLTFTLALRELMASEPERAAVAFSALHLNARDEVVRSRARIGLTMALSWYSDWQALSRIGVNPDTIPASDSMASQAGVERWAHALQAMPLPEIDVPDLPVTVPLRRSSLGTPVVTVRVNGHPHEFWLDTGASMTLLSVAVANEAGVGLASNDTLALGVIAGHIPARAVYVDSLAFGPVNARGITAALVSSSALRLDHRLVNGQVRPIQIDGVIGTDITFVIAHPAGQPEVHRGLCFRRVTHAGQRVRRTDTRLVTLGHQLQQPIPDRMTQGIVDLLETVQVNEQDRHHEAALFSVP